MHVALVLLFYCWCQATFPMPTSARRHKVYEPCVSMQSRWSDTLAPADGSLDILRAVVMFLHQHQQGYGVVAVSPR